ncbi:MAG TPA: ABC-2 family transporter protein, partial [Candidatus Acidoferrum sp.]|nr:ABC-2 family transporter protein [Candidatus Acidoferrum sp.]
VVLTLVVPALASASLPVAVMLGKFDMISGLGLGFGAAALLSVIKMVIWKSALRHYTSASS